MVEAEDSKQMIVGLISKIETDLHACYQAKQLGQNLHPVNGKQVSE